MIYDLYAGLKMGKLVATNETHHTYRDKKGYYRIILKERATIK
ncbi:hypothetical protein OAF54_03255 [bacterium]|nr:hypothetical protein [bacterium]